VSAPTKIRADIAELLRAGVPHAHICRQLRCAPITVQRTREALNLPAPKTCRPLPATVEDAFRQYARPVDGGHAEWTGPYNNGAPRVTHEGTVYSVYRLAYRMANGREPEGLVRPSCGRGRCVMPGHHEDRVDRAARRQREREERRREKRVDALYAAIFGPAP
jgi:hypothetical protein